MKNEQEKKIAKIIKMSGETCDASPTHLNIIIIFFFFQRWCEHTTRMQNHQDPFMPLATTYTLDRIVTTNGVWMRQMKIMVRFMLPAREEFAVVV